MADLRDAAVTSHSGVRNLRGLRRGDIAEVGGKAANLGELLAAGLPVPNGFVVTTEGYQQFVREAGIGASVLAAAREVAGASDQVAAAERAAETIAELMAGHDLPADLSAEILDAYAELCAAPGEEQGESLRGQVAVAVRSSATAEDLAEASFAGQQETYLNVSGAGAVLDAVRRCWQSLWTARAISYRARVGIDPGEVSLAVVVQDLVDADASGVLFTANPANGRRDEMLISAAWGLGESVVGGSVSPDEVVLRRAGDDLVVQRTRLGDKEVRTLRSAGGTVEAAVPSALRDRLVLRDTESLWLGGLGMAIADHYGVPMDIEWARRGDRFAIVQARPITSLPEPTGPVPTEWKLPEEKDFYFRASIVEQLPDPLTPLFGDVISAAVPVSLNRLFTSLMGRGYHPGDVAFPQINGYAYYQYSRAGLLRLSLAAIPLLLTGGLGSAEQVWREEYHPNYAAAVERWRAVDLAAVDAATLLDGVLELTLAGCVYYTSVQRVIPVASFGEVAFSSLYEKLLRRPSDPPATTFVLGGDSQPIRAERSLYDLARWCGRHPALAAVLQNGSENAAALAFGAAPAEVPAEDWAQWQERLQAHLARFGHAVYNLDFATPVAADDPAPVLQALRYQLSQTRPDPAERQTRLLTERRGATDRLLARLDPLSRALVGRLLTSAQHYAPIREDALADVGLAWPVIRGLLAELGRRLVGVGLLAEPSQVYWLREEELRSVIGQLGGVDRFDPVTALIEQRQLTWRGQRLAEPPDLLPQTGINSIWRRWMPSADQQGSVLRGLGASGGRVTAPACVVLSPDDFAKMTPGSVLVAPITTPAFTPLFTMAAAVVTDIGGPLSHSSIVAREYGIPAVLGVGVASRRIADGDLLVVDGDAGTVGVAHDAEEPGAAPQPAASPAGARGRAALRRVLAAATVAGTVLAVGLVLRRRRG